jgi:hypothetical protein
MIAPLLMMMQVAPGTPQRFSIMTDPCASASDDDGHDVVVCGRPDAISPRLPMRDDRGPPDHPVPVNPEMTGTGALAAEGTPCAAIIGGCTVGFGQPVVAKALELAGYGLKDLKDARARHRDGARRVAIDLSEPPAPNPAAALRP